jgi:alkylation response protein AidB-like acyl-CoA dehydrogenase
LHPGGRKVLLGVAGQDATKQFDEFHKIETLQKYIPKLAIGRLNVPNVEKKKNPKIYGDVTPYTDPAWYKGFNTPYFNASHHKFRQACREFTEKELMPNCFEWEETRTFPKDFHKKAYLAGLYPGMSGYWPTKYTGDVQPAGGVDPKEWNYFHELILLDETARCGSSGVCSMMGEGIGLGLPPVLNFGSEELKDRIVPDVVRGEKIICLAITEPGAGSDVANIKTEARKTEDGKFFIVSGEKKWITSGMFADYFTVAVRTGGKGMGGISLLLLDRNMGGIKTRHMKCSGLWASGTAFVEMTDVKVPVENLIGKENEGFKAIMFNFNHERLIIIVQTIRFARVCWEDAFNYAHKRKTFGMRLIDNPLIRNKLGNMIRQIEATQAWLEFLTFQMITMPYVEANVKLGGPVALLKVQSTQVLEFCAREAVQIFGGLGYTRGGQGERVERLYRDARAMAILGGADEVMIDLGIKGAMKGQSKM